jgi:PKD repeat protein
MVRPLPLANFTNNITCIGDSTQFADLSNPIEGNIIKWVWNFGDGDSSIFQNPTHTYNANGDYFVKLFIENSVGCFNDTTIKITVRPLPTVTFTHPPIGCPDSSIFFLLTTVDAVQYNWDFGDGNTGTGANPTHIYTNSGTYTIRLNAVTQFGCIDSSTSTIIIAERPSAYFIATPDSGCGPLSVVIRYLPQTSANGFDYTWTLGNGDTIFSMIPPDTVVYLPPTLNGDTTYYISAWVQSRVCQQIDVHRDSVKVFSVPRISFIPNNSDGCSPLYVNFSNQTKGLIDSILIDFGNGNDTIIYGRGAVYQTFQNYSNTDTFYHVKFKAFNKCGITEDSLVISVFPNTVNASINIVPPNNCANEIFTLYNNSSGARYIYYDLGSGYPNISSDTSKTITFSMSESGEYWIYQYIYSGDSCSADIDSFKITVYEDPNSDFDYKDSNKVCAGSIQVIFINKSIDAVKYYWNLDDGNTINQFEPFYEYETSGRYDVLLIAESEFGCRDSLLKTISLEYKNSGLYVPNAFSPEFGEEVVRTFKPAGLCLATYKLSIYNTWGELVWETDKIENEQPAEGWDGRHMKTGVLLPQDV